MALEAARDEVTACLPRWHQDSIVPASENPGSFELRPRPPDVRNQHLGGFLRAAPAPHPRSIRRRVPPPDSRDPRRLDGDLAQAILTELALMQGKALNYNARQTSWHVGRQKIRSVFEKHNFAFKWTFVEFPGPANCSRGASTSSWTRTTRSPGSWRRPGVPCSAGRRFPGQSGSPARTPLTCRRCRRLCAASLHGPAVLRERDVLGAVQFLLRVGTGHAREDLAGPVPGREHRRRREAVTNEARFAAMGRRKKALADLDYEAKMAAIFAECRRILADNGVLTVMFTNKDARAWDALGSALITAGFVVETSWPVATESESSSHQANKNAAESTIMLVCRKRPPAPEAKSSSTTWQARCGLPPVQRSVQFAEDGIDGVDLMLSTYGPALSVISSHWPVYSSTPDEIGPGALLRPEEALDHRPRGGSALAAQPTGRQGCSDR